MEKGNEKNTHVPPSTFYGGDGDTSDDGKQRETLVSLPPLTMPNDTVVGERWCSNSHPYRSLWCAFLLLWLPRASFPEEKFLIRAKTLWLPLDGTDLEDRLDGR